MWQRPQTLYILLALLCLGISFLVPLFSLIASDWVLHLYVYGMRGEVPAGVSESLAAVPIPLVALLALFIGIAGLQAAAVGLYKKRPLQIRLLTLANILVALLFALVAYILRRLMLAHTDASLQVGYGAIVALAGVVFNLLALRGIRRDENLVRSMHRLR